MRIRAQAHEALAILAAMRDVASIGRELTEADRARLVAAGHWMFGLDVMIDTDRLPSMNPFRLGDVVDDPGLRDEAARFLTVMAFVDGTLDAAKITRVLAYAAAIGVRAEYIDEIAAAAKGSLAWALGYMVRANLESITGRP